MNTVTVGSLYEHTKSKKIYKVIALAKHSETTEPMVVYEGQYEDNPVWVRPLGMFLEEVELDGKRVPRFREII